MIVRVEQPSDASAVRQIHEAAFGRAGEADLVDALRAEGVVFEGYLALELSAGALDGIRGRVRYPRAFGI